MFCWDLGDVFYIILFCFGIFCLVGLSLLTLFFILSLIIIEKETERKKEYINRQIVKFRSSGMN